MIDWINTENAFVETYFVAMKRQDDPEPDITSRDDLIVGRYLDHFQKRENNWRVANRMVVYDLTQKLIADGSEPPMNGSRGRRDSNDPAIAFRAKIATQ
ncbi:hypothetical protein HED55_22590 [Ochrobactrum haematophilum]|uniref:SnoaL-like domain-containing protein n=2 Tax=Brucella haematophila TaxID=419474 RepID=A0ABX1DPU3_9HYPH|nr:hypothetical protein [Brucella haematophila]